MPAAYFAGRFGGEDGSLPGLVDKHKNFFGVTILKGPVSKQDDSMPNRAKPLAAAIPRTLLIRLGILPFVAIAVVLVSCQRAAPMPSAPPTSSIATPTPTDFETGDRVVARGSVVRASGLVWVSAALEDARLGKPEPRNQADREAPRLDAIPSATLRGLDPTSLPQWTQWSQFGFSAPVIIHGTWAGDAIEVTEIEPFALDPDRSALDCDTRVQIEGRQPGSEAEYEAAKVSLDTLVFGNPRTFAGNWTRPGPERVIVVGTINDPLAAQRRIVATFPYPVCARQVEFSADDLNAALPRIDADHPEWLRKTAYGVNRITIAVPYLSDDAWALVRPYPEAVPWPLVRPDPAASDK